MNDSMKHMFIFSLLLTMVFLAISFANEEPENSRELPKDIEARMERFREIAEQAERSRAERLDGREVLVRVYNNWQENYSEFETVYIQLDGSTIMLDSDDIDESAFIVVVKEDQEDEVVIFRNRLPEAKEVHLAGDFNDWMPHTTPMRRLGNGDFETRLRLPQGRYRYRLVIDGRWSHDHENSAVEANEYGELNSIVEVMR